MRRPWMKTVGLALLSACRGPSPVRYTQGGDDVAVEKGRTYTFALDGAAHGALPPTFINVLGDWAVEPDDTPGAKVLERVGARDEVIVAVHEAEHQAACLIEGPALGTTAHAECEIGEAKATDDDARKVGIAEGSALAQEWPPAR